MLRISCDLEAWQVKQGDTVVKAKLHESSAETDKSVKLIPR